MTNLGPQFQTKDWNPFLGASSLLNKVTAYSEYYSRALTQSNVHNKNVQEHVAAQQPAQPTQKEQKMTPYQEQAKTERQTQMAKIWNPAKASIGTKRSGYRMTPAGTKPKKK